MAEWLQRALDVYDWVARIHFGLFVLGGAGLIVSAVALLLELPLYSLVALAVGVAFIVAGALGWERSRLPSKAKEPIPQTATPESGTSPERRTAVMQVEESVQTDAVLAPNKPRHWRELKPHQETAYRDALCVERTKLIKRGQILDDQAAERGATVARPVGDWCASVQRHAYEHWKIAAIQFRRQISEIQPAKSAFPHRSVVRQYLTWLHQYGALCDDAQ